MRLGLALRVAAPVIGARASKLKSFPLVAAIVIP
jgi:hypothetical protein